MVARRIKKENIRKRKSTSTKLQNELRLLTCYGYNCDYIKQKEEPFMINNKEDVKKQYEKTGFLFWRAGFELGNNGDQSM